MYTDSAYWHNQLQAVKLKTHPLFVTSCGTYHLINTPKFTTHRPNGRMDYQLLYVASGKAHFYLDGVEQVIPAGNMILYRPGEEQQYSYYGTDHPEVYWLHFTGGNVENILRKYSIADHMRILHTGTSLEYKRIFLQIIQELKLCREDYEALAVNYLQQLLVLIHRQLEQKPREKSQFLVEEIDSAIRYFHENYHTLISIEEYAASHHMSVSWFIRRFKEYTGSTPTQYILSLRISNAQTLLDSTNYHITEIAEIVGYDNPLYFSRLFRKHSGMSPSEFRSRLRTEASVEPSRAPANRTAPSDL